MALHDDFDGRADAAFPMYCVPPSGVTPKVYELGLVRVLDDGTLETRTISRGNDRPTRR